MSAEAAEAAEATEAAKTAAEVPAEAAEAKAGVPAEQGGPSTLAAPGQLQLRPGAVPAALETFGWTPRPELSCDENALDFALLLARSSNCKGGSMGCLLSSANGDVFSCATNSPITPTDAKKPSSDLHAEVNAIGRCARLGIATEGCTAYITMPPCKKCLGVLVASGVRRIVTRKNFCEQDARELLPQLRRLSIPFDVVGDTEARRSHLDRLASKRKRPLEEQVPKDPD